MILVRLINANRAEKGVAKVIVGVLRGARVMRRTRLWRFRGEGWS